MRIAFVSHRSVKGHSVETESSREVFILDDIPHWIPNRWIENTPYTVNLSDAEREIFDKVSPKLKVLEEFVSTDFDHVILYFDPEYFNLEDPDNPKQKREFHQRMLHRLLELGSKKITFITCDCCAKKRTIFAEEKLGIDPDKILYSDANLGKLLISALYQDYQHGGPLVPLLIEHAHS